MRTFRDEPAILGQDPFLFRPPGEDQYYLIESQDEERILIYPVESLQYPRRIGTPRLIRDDKRERQVWSPEIHQIGGAWYIFYSSSDGENRNHRNKILGPAMYWYGPYPTTPRQTGPDYWGIDQTAFMHNWQWYTVWSGWYNHDDEFPQRLFISKWGSNERQVIASPGYDWEGEILEGPQWTGSSLLYSANKSWTQDYSTGLLMIKPGCTDLTNPGAWYKVPYRIFYNTGHAQYIDDYLIYHRKETPLEGWQDRTINSMYLPNPE